MMARLALVVASLLLFDAAASAQRIDPGRTTLAWLQKFVAVAYPEVIEKKLEAHVLVSPAHQWNGYLPHVMLGFTEPLPGPPREKTLEELLKEQVLLLIVEQFDARLHAVFAHGPLVRPASLEALEQALDTEHPEWSEEEIETYLRGSNLRYGPGARDAMVKALRLDRFEPLLGRLSVTGTQFLSRDDIEGAQASLRWEVSVVSRTGRRFAIYVEPTAARIRSIVTRDSQ